MKQIKENLNKEKKKDKFVEENQKQIYKALQYFIRNDRETVIYRRKKLAKDFPIKHEILAHLNREEFINWDEYTADVHWLPEHFITKKGYKEFCDLTKIYQEFWIACGAKVGVASFIISLIVLYFTGVSQGWWTDFLHIAKLS